MDTLPIDYKILWLDILSSGVLLSFNFTEKSKLSRHVRGN